MVLLAATIAPEPMAVELLIVVPETVSAPDPKKVLLLLSVFKTSPALDPTAVLLSPCVLFFSVTYPSVVLSLPMVFSLSPCDLTKRY